MVRFLVLHDQANSNKILTNVNKITHIEGSNDGCIVHLTNGSIVFASESIDTIQEVLIYDRF